MRQYRLCVAKSFETLSFLLVEVTNYSIIQVNEILPKLFEPQLMIFKLYLNIFSVVIKSLEFDLSRSGLCLSAGPFFLCISFLGKASNPSADISNKTQVTGQLMLSEQSYHSFSGPIHQ